MTTISRHLKHECVIIVICAFIVRGLNSYSNETQVCYGKAVFPTCSTGTKMAIEGLLFGVKTPSSDCPSNSTYHQKPSCCTYSCGDYMVAMTLYKHIYPYYHSFSGHQTPKDSTPRAQWRRIRKSDNCTVGRDFSNFVSMQYQCIPDSAILNMAIMKTLVATHVYLMYPFVGGLRAREDCVCTVTTSGQSGLVIFALDIRLQSYIDYSNETCDHGNHSLTISDDTQLQTWTCNGDAAILGKYDTIFETSESSVVVTFRRDEDYRPQSIWLGAKSRYSAVDVTISCNQPHDTTETTTPRRSTILSIIHGGNSRQTTGNHVILTSTTPSGGGGGNGSNQTDHLVIILAATGAAALLVFAIAVIICIRHRKRVEKRKAEAFDEYRRQMRQNMHDHGAKRSKMRDQFPTDEQDGRQVKQKDRDPGKHDHKKKRKLNVDAPTGLEVDMNDPVYHDFIPQRKTPQRQARDAAPQQNIQMTKMAKQPKTAPRHAAREEHVQNKRKF